MKMQFVLDWLSCRLHVILGQLGISHWLLISTCKLKVKLDGRFGMSGFLSVGHSLGPWGRKWTHVIGGEVSEVILCKRFHAMEWTKSRQSPCGYMFSQILYCHECLGRCGFLNHSVHHLSGRYSCLWPIGRRCQT